MESKNANFLIYNGSYIARRNTERAKTALGLNPGSLAICVVHSVGYWHVDYHIALKLCLSSAL